MHFWEWTVIIVILVGAVVFTLAWWKIADKWADAEHRRFGPSGGSAPVERIVIRTPAADDPPAPSPDAPESTPGKSQ